MRLNTYKIAGAILLVWGFAGVVGADDMRVTAAASNILNTGLLQDQLMAFQWGAVEFLCGVLLLGFGGMVSRVSSPEQVAADEDAVADLWLAANAVLLVALAAWSVFSISEGVKGVVFPDPAKSEACVAARQAYDLCAANTYCGLDEFRTKLDARKQACGDSVEEAAAAPAN